MTRLLSCAVAWRMKHIQILPDAGAAPSSRPLPKGTGAAILFSAALLVSGWAMIGLGALGGLVGMSALLGGACLVVHFLRRTYPHDRLGGCNLVTMMRLSLVALLLGGVAEGGLSGWPVVFAASLALALDGVDGWLARRSGLASDFGGRFDLEVDAALALVLAVLALQSPHYGPAVLVLGLMRYVFLLGGVFAPWMRASLPYSQRRRVICVVQLAALIALQLPLAQTAPLAWGARLAAIALIWSFAVDTLWLWRNAR
ncbi:MAG: CDP-alcohol phosphatidyltransferase family protein [Paracoccus sp. (in: a-proteobacteria)]|nr:CDP-alcohol phosphatidyltransferase family protein [Paracoccus sp. (in: a-proteobacteria)]